MILLFKKPTGTHYFLGNHWKNGNSYLCLLSRLEILKRYFIFWKSLPSFHGFHRQRLLDSCVLGFRYTWYGTQKCFIFQQSTEECTLCMYRQKQQKSHSKVPSHKQHKHHIKVPSWKRLSCHQWNFFLYLFLPFRFPWEVQVAVLHCLTENPWTYCEFNKAYLASVMGMPL